MISAIIARGLTGNCASRNFLVVIVKIGVRLQQAPAEIGIIITARGTPRTAEAITAVIRLVCMRSVLTFQLPSSMSDF